MISNNSKFKCLRRKSFLKSKSQNSRQCKTSSDYSNTSRSVIPRHMQLNLIKFLNSNKSPQSKRARTTKNLLLNESNSHYLRQLSFHTLCRQSTPSRSTLSKKFLKRKTATQSTGHSIKAISKRQTR